MGRKNVKPEKGNKNMHEEGGQEGRGTRNSHHPCLTMDPTVHRKHFSCVVSPRVWSNIPPSPASGPAFGEYRQIPELLFRSSFIEITLDSPTICRFKYMMRTFSRCHLSQSKMCHSLTKTPCILRCHPLACSGGCYRFPAAWT